MILHLPSTRRRGASGVFAGFVLAASLAACGGASGTGNDGVVSLASPSASPAAPGAPGASVDPEEAMQAFTKCMKEHGVDIQVAVAVDGSTSGTLGGPSLNSSGPGTAVDPQAGGGATDVDPKKMEEADKACRDLLPSGMMGDPNATVPPEQVEQLLGFAKCMREHGVDFPDPQFSGGGVSVQVGGDTGQGTQAVDPTSKAYQDAQAACAKDMPSGAPFVVGGSSTEIKP